MRLLDYRYDEPRKLILWHLRDETPGTPVEWQEITYAYLAGDLLAQFNIDVSKLSVKGLTKLKEIVLKFSNDIKNRPWPFKIRVESTARMIDPAEWKETATADWKDEIQRVKSGQDYEPQRLHVNNTKLLEAHDDMDRYPFYEVQSLIAEERAKGR
jgi:hypothetical protein